jgi:hypothetical protein
MFELFMGIDPGRKGGIAVCDGRGWVKAMPMPRDEREIAELLAGYVGGVALAALEKVGPMPSDARSRMWAFAENYGFLRGCLRSLGVPFFDVAPQRWQRELNVIVPELPPLPKGDDKARKKVSAVRRRLRKAAQSELAGSLYPRASIVNETADAVLLMELARRRHYARSRATSGA